MTAKPLDEAGTQRSLSAPTDGSAEPIDPRQRALALGLELSKRSVEAHTLDDLYLLLTNDLRALLEFDRSLLIVHVGGDSRFVAAGGQPELDKRSKFYEQVHELAPAIREVRRGLLLSGKVGALGLTEKDVPPVARAALQSYLDFSGCAFLFFLPLTHEGNALGHLILEFFDEKAPEQVNLLTLLNISPFLGTALSEKWLMHKKPALKMLLDPQTHAGERTQRLKHYLTTAGAVAVGLVILFFLIPFPFDVGGEAEIIPTIRHLAFCKIDGIVDRIFVAEGSRVTKGGVLASLEPKELDYKVRSARTQFEILSNEMVLLRRSAAENPAKLAESDVVALKRKAAWEELSYYEWQQKFLKIEAPSDGIILTKDIESLSGKKFRAGEPFCEIVAPGDLSAEVFVPEDKITYVKKGQPVTIYLGAEPRKGYKLSVNEIAPMAEALPRLGSVFRVRAPFPDAPPSTMVGMKGIGKIHAMNTSLWFIVTQRLLSRWQRLAIHF